MHHTFGISDCALYCGSHRTWIKEPNSCVLGVLSRQLQWWWQLSRNDQYWTYWALLCSSVIPPKLSKSYTHSRCWIQRTILRTQMTLRFMATFPFRRLRGQLLSSDISSCIETAKVWVASNRLLLNPPETEFIWLGSSRRLENIPSDPITVSGVNILISKNV